MSIGALTDVAFAERLGPTKHEAGCFYGGFSCGYWLIADGCELEHWERHIVDGDRCPCGTLYPAAGTTIVFFDASA